MQDYRPSDIESITPLWMLNHMHYLASRREGKRGMLFSRFAGFGSQRYGIGFSGDTVISWESLAFQPYFTATASNIGFSRWNHDIGGHLRGYKDDELAVRWIQFGVFSPILRLHSNDSPFLGREPWSYQPYANALIGELLRLRHARYTVRLDAARADVGAVVEVLCGAGLMHDDSDCRERLLTMMTRAQGPLLPKDDLLVRLDNALSRVEAGHGFDRNFFSRCVPNGLPEACYELVSQLMRRPGRELGEEDSAKMTIHKTNTMEPLIKSSYIITKDKSDHENSILRARLREICS